MDRWQKCEKKVRWKMMPTCFDCCDYNALAVAALLRDNHLTAARHYDIKFVPFISLKGKHMNLTVGSQAAAHLANDVIAFRPENFVHGSSEGQEFEFIQMDKVAVLGEHGYEIV